MKKALSLFLILFLLLGSLTLPVFAGELTDVGAVVTAPVAGQKPDFRGAPEDRLLNLCEVKGIQWCEWDEEDLTPGDDLTENSVFEYGKYYMVFITLKMKDSSTSTFTLRPAVKINGVACNTYNARENGKEVTFYRLLSTAKQPLSAISLTLTAPKDGEKPVWNAVSGTGYRSQNESASTAVYKNGIAWFKTSYSAIAPGTNEAFVGGTAYTAKVRLVAEEGYQFTSVSSATINGKAATVELQNEEELLVSVALTAAEKEHVHTPSAYKSDENAHWKECTACSAVTTARAAHADANGDNRCDVCAYALPEQSPLGGTTPTPPASTAPVTPDEPVETPEVTPPVEESEEVIGEPEEEIDEEPEVPEEEEETAEEKPAFPIALVCILGAAVLVIAAVVLILVLKQKKKAPEAAQTSDEAN